jgi:predicted dehydrogenase
MVRCGLIGCGNVAAEMHVPAIRALENVRLEAVCDTDPERMATFAAGNGIGKRFARVDEFLDQNGDLDFVIIATPGFTHHAVAKQVIAAGLDVLVEKPLALRHDQCLELKRDAESRGVKVCVGQTWRFRDPVIKAKRALDEGLIGQIYQVTIAHHGGSLFHVSEPCWSWEEKRHRTLLYDHAIHLLDLAVYFAGPVQRLLGIQVIDDPHLQVTARVYALVEHTSGAVGLVDLQMFASSNFTQCDFFGTANDVQIKFFPHSYQLYSGRVNPLDELCREFTRLKDFVVPRLSRAVWRPAVPPRALPHYRLLVNWVQSLTDPSAKPPVTIDDVLPTMEFLELLANHVYG